MPRENLNVQVNGTEPVSIDEVRAILSGPPLLVGYHGTRALSKVLRKGLRVNRTGLGCRHICLSPAPELAAMFAFGEDAAVLQVDLEGLGIPSFIGNEARSHVNISPDRLTVIEREIIPSFMSPVDPVTVYAPVQNHPHCWPYLTSGRRWLRG